MSRKTKIIYGILAIIFAFISSVIGLWLLANGDYNGRSRFIMQFFLMVTPTIVVLAIINLLRKDN